MVYSPTPCLMHESAMTGAVSLSFQYWDRDCNCWFFFISRPTKFNGLVCNMEYVMYLNFRIIVVC